MEVPDQDFIPAGGLDLDGVGQHALRARERRVEEVWPGPSEEPAPR